jgi:hypothetical protein
MLIQTKGAVGKSPSPFSIEDDMVTVCRSNSQGFGATSRVRTQQGGRPELEDGRLYRDGQKEGMI